MYSFSRIKFYLNKIHPAIVLADSFHKTQWWEADRGACCFVLAGIVFACRHDPALAATKYNFCTWLFYSLRSLTPPEIFIASVVPILEGFLTRCMIGVLDLVYACRLGQN